MTTLIAMFIFSSLEHREAGCTVSVYDACSMGGYEVSMAVIDFAEKVDAAAGHLGDTPVIEFLYETCENYADSIFDFMLSNERFPMFHEV